ncbi:MAG: hypothetical protein JO018_06055 [Candidatus Eremiobacteraeota bacterium]|nr:hypothetical protein [Candidatus Eremiobacteraeota bacterium]
MIDHLLAVIEQWHRAGTTLSSDAFNALALQTFEHQLRHNAPYQNFCASLGVTASALPSRWQDIPPVPVSAFKDATLTTFEPQSAELRFETSGTTSGRPGRHYMKTSALYRAALTAGFDRAMLQDHLRLRYLNVMPSWPDKPHSSLSYMMQTIVEQRGDGGDGWYVRGEELLVDAFISDLEAAISDGVVVCIAGTAFGLLNLVEALEKFGKRFALRSGSRIMETGGFKGRSKVIERGDFYALLSLRFGIPADSIVAEYGMTELTSQYYDSLESRTQSERVKTGPPWLAWRIVDAAGNDVPPGARGMLIHFDLANRDSVLALATDDLAYALEDGFVLCGRVTEADARGCSLDAEELWSRAR